MSATTDRTIEHWPLDHLVPYARNPRIHSVEQIARIVASIREFGFTNPILVDEDAGILAGHGRLAAARDLAMETVPVIVLTGLSDVQRRAYIIADNKLALDSSWDIETLRQEMETLLTEEYAIELTGFEQEEINALLEMHNDAEHENTSQRVFDTDCKFAILIQCETEQQQRELFESFQQQNLQCKLIT